MAPKPNQLLLDFADLLEEHNVTVSYCQDNENIVFAKSDGDSENPDNWVAVFFSEEHSADEIRAVAGSEPNITILGG